MSPGARRAGAAVLVVVSLVGLPLSLLLTDEPPLILALSWLAITITALDVWATTDVRATQREE